VGVALDITSTVEVQRTMERREAMTRAVFESSPSALMVSDSSSTGKVLFFNQLALSIYRLNAQDLLDGGIPSIFAGLRSACTFEKG